jgi:hypothetical protein
MERSLRMGQLEVVVHCASVQLLADDASAKIVASISCAGEKLKTAAVSDASAGWDQAFKFTLVDPGRCGVDFLACAGQ